MTLGSQPVHPALLRYPVWQRARPGLYQLGAPSLVELISVTEIGSSNVSANPASTVTVTTDRPVAPGEILFFYFVVNSASTATATATAGGNAMTQDGLSARTGAVTVVLFRYEPSVVLPAGSTVTAAVGSAGSGSAAKCIKVAGLVPGAGLNATLGSANGLSQVPVTGASGTPPGTDAVFVLSILGVSVGTAGQAGMPGNNFAPLTEVVQTTRLTDLVSAYDLVAAPAGVQNTSWGPNGWGATKAWVGLEAVYKVVVPAAPVNTVAPTLSGPGLVGTTLQADPGQWLQAPTSYLYDWQRDVGTAGATYVSIGSSQTVTLGSGSPNVAVSSIVLLRVGQPVYGPGIPTGAVISEITDATHIVLSAAATATGPGTVYFGADGTSATYPVTAEDIGCRVRCAVTAVNGLGASSPAVAAALGTTPVPSWPTWRVVVAPLAQSDNQNHSSTLRLPVLPGETLVYFGTCSVANTGGNIGSITDDAGDTWQLRAEFAPAQAFTTVCAPGMPYGAVVSTHVKQTTVVGVNALNSGTINVVDTTGFDAAGTIRVNGLDVTYTGITPTSLTGCGAHAAYTGGESVAYHGQSPYWMVLALNPGNASKLTFDVATANQSAFGGTATTTAVATAGPVSLAVAFHNRGAVELWTPAAGWTKTFDGPLANAGNPFTGESGFSAAAEAQVVNGPQTSFTASGTNASNDQLSNVMVVFSVTSLLVPPVPRHPATLYRPWARRPLVPYAAPATAVPITVVATAADATLAAPAPAAALAAPTVAADAALGAPAPAVAMVVPTAAATVTLGAPAPTLNMPIVVVAAPASMALSAAAPGALLAATASPAAAALSAPAPAVALVPVAAPASMALGAPAPSGAVAAQATAATAILGAAVPGATLTLATTAASMTLGAPVPTLARVVAAAPAHVALSAPAPTLATAATTVAALITLEAVPPHIASAPISVAPPPATLTLSVSVPAVVATAGSAAASMALGAPAASLRTTATAAAASVQLGAPVPAVAAVVPTGSGTVTLAALPPHTAYAAPTTAATVTLTALVPRLSIQRLLADPAVTITERTYSVAVTEGGYAVTMPYPTQVQ